MVITFVSYLDDVSIVLERHLEHRGPDQAPTVISDEFGTWQALLEQRPLPRSEVVQPRGHREIVEVGSVRLDVVLERCQPIV